MAAKKVDIMELRQLLLLKNKNHKTVYILITIFIYLLMEN